MIKSKSFPIRVRVLVILVPAVVYLLTLSTPSLAAQEPDPPNVLWIMLDDCRAGALGCYGEPWAKTPTMDAIADDGVRFETAVVQNMVCSPSRNSMLTGQYCHRLHHMAMGKPPAVEPDYLPEEVTENQIDLRAALKAVDMQPLNVGKSWGNVWENISYSRPSAYAGPGKGDGHYAMVRLPDHGWQVGGTTTTDPADMRPARMTDAALNQLDQLTAEQDPWFLRVSYKAPHVPIVCPPQFMIDPDAVQLPYPSDEELELKSQFEREQLSLYSGTLELSREQIQIARGTYYGMVSMVDHQIGRLIKQLEKRGSLKNTLIVITGDHGLQMGEHGLHKKRNFYEQTVKVPFILSWPQRLPKGKVIQEQVEMIDMLPTILELIGAPATEGIPGHSLLPLVDGRVRSWRPAVFSEIDHSGSFYDELRVDSGRRVMVRTKDWKLIYFRDSRVSEPDGSLYDLKNDPGETRNLYGNSEYSSVKAELESLVNRWDRGEHWKPSLP